MGNRTAEQTRDAQATLAYDPRDNVVSVSRLKGVPTAPL